jgi:GNAT superfamily N-acetyltransferase
MGEWQIRLLEKRDIPTLSSSFAEVGWNKTTTLFLTYLDEQEKDQRRAWVAFKDEFCLGYVTLRYASYYPHFLQNKIPEIMDLNVLPQYRSQGIGSALLDIAECVAQYQGDRVGLGVGLYPDYGSAQRIYVKRGYIPDGMGVTYNYRRVLPGEMIKLDDDLVLWFVKKFYKQ